MSNIEDEKQKWDFVFLFNLVNDRFVIIMLCKYSYCALGSNNKLVSWLKISISSSSIIICFLFTHTPDHATSILNVEHSSERCYYYRFQIKKNSIVFSAAPWTSFDFLFVFSINFVIVASLVSSSPSVLLINKCKSKKYQ